MLYLLKHQREIHLRPRTDWMDQRAETDKAYTFQVVLILFRRYQAESSF
jgi:hypothetical protein